MPTPSTSFWRKYRQDFPITKSCIYLDHASGGPMPTPVIAEIQRHQNEHLKRADFAWPVWMKRRDAMRAKVARFINADPEEIAFTQGTSYGMNLVAELIHDKGTVLTNDLEFPSSTLPWLWRKSKVQWQKSSGGSVSLETMKKHLRGSVKTIVSSFVQYRTGFRQDLEALGQLKGDRFLVVNATQGFGAMKVDVKRWNVDFLVTNSYKWLMAGYGGGILYIKKDILKKLRPSGIGWRSMVDPDQMNNRLLQPRKEGARYEWSCPSFPTLFAVGAAVDYLSKVGISRIQKRILTLTDYAIDRLKQNGFEVISPLEKSSRSGIVVIRMKRAKLLWKKLLAKKIYTSPRGEGLRIAPHFYNTESEIEYFVKALQKANRK